MQIWIRQGRVTVGGVTVSEPRQKLWGGECIELSEGPDEHSETSVPEAIALNILHEDETLIVLDKQAPVLCIGSTRTPVA